MKLTKETREKYAELSEKAAKATHEWLEFTEKHLEQLDYYAYAPTIVHGTYILLSKVYELQQHQHIPRRLAVRILENIQRTVTILVTDDNMARNILEADQFIKEIESLFSNNQKDN